MTTSERFPTPRATDADKGGRGELLSVVRTGHPRAPSTSDQLTFFAGDSLARTSQRRVAGQESKAPAPDYGASTPVLLARYDRATSSWRTSQLCLDGDLTVFSETFPRSGMTRNGTAYRLRPLVRLTAGTGCGLWPTPRASEAMANGRPGRPDADARLEDVVANWPTPQARDSTNRAGQPHRYLVEKRYNLQDALAAREIRGSLNPTWVEWLMGFPLGWTDLEASATQPSRKTSR